MPYEPQTPAEAERVRAGKAGELWRIEILFYHNDRSEIKRQELTNYTGNEVMQFREAVFKVGLKVCVDPGHWIVAPPWEIREINLYKQNTFFEP